LIVLLVAGLILVVTTTASDSGGGLSASDYAGIAASALAFLTLLAAIRALKYAKDSADAAKESVDAAKETVGPLQNVATNTNEAAKLQTRALEMGRQALRADELARRASHLREIVTALAEMPKSQETSPDEAALERRFKATQWKLVIALSMLRSGELPKSRDIARVPHFNDALELIVDAQREAAPALDEVVAEMERLTA